MGLITSTESAEAAARFADTLDDLRDVLEEVRQVIGSSLGPYLEELTNSIVTAAVKVRQWIADHRGLVVVLFKTAGAIVLAGAGFSLFGRILGMLAGGITAVVSGIRMVGTIISLAGTLITGAWTGITAVIGMVGSALVAVALARRLGRSGRRGAWCDYFLYVSGIGGQVLDWLGGAFSELGPGRHGRLRCHRRRLGFRRHRPGRQGAVDACSRWSGRRASTSSPSCGWASKRPS